MIQVIRNNRLVHGDQKGHHHSIYSIDFQFGGCRLATGGGDATVRIWDLNSITSEDNQDNVALAVLSNHTKSVNTVRWSRDGTFLASGSDDCYILIYKLEVKETVNTQSIGGFQSSHNKENWMRIFTLHGHHMDVLDIDWSPAGLLASASIDNNILIWDIPSSFKSSLRVVAPARQLQQHTSFVKGVQFDPFGIFLASASADNTIIIWNCENWKVEHILEEPFRDSADRSIFRRLSWAPDGGSLCVTCATKGGKPIGMVLKRDTWMSVADLVGHNVQTTCCRFNPHHLRISNLSTSGDKSSSTNIFTACTVALGDQQGVISCWTTTQNSPLFVIQNVFDGPVLDLTWFALTDTTMLLSACSLDGSILILKLSGVNATGGERCLTLDERDLHLKSIYGRGDKELSNTSPNLPEDPAVIRFSQMNQLKHHSIPQTHSQIQTQALSVTQTPPQKRKSSTIQSPPATFQQNVTRLKNGKKRIQPIVTDSEIPEALVQNIQSFSQPQSTEIPHHEIVLDSFHCTLKPQQNPASQYFENLNASCILRKSLSSLENVTSTSSSTISINSLQSKMNVLTCHRYLTASELRPPRSIDPSLSVITFAKFRDSVIPCPLQIEWETYVTGKVTAICGVQFPTTSQKIVKGVAVIGTSLGSLVLLCLSSGIKLHSPLILGGSVIGVDSVYLKETRSFHIFALSSEGDIWLFRFQLNGLIFSLICKSSLRSLRSYLGIRQSIHLERADLTESGELNVSVKSSDPNRDGTLLHFQFLSDLQCWRQIYHLNSFLSKSRNEIDEMLIPTEPKLELSQIISRSLSHSATSSTSSSVSFSTTDNQFYKKLTFAEIEDNLVLSISQKQLENTRNWIYKWIFHCCQCGFESRIKLLVSLLLEDEVSSNTTLDENDDSNFGWIGNLSSLLLGCGKLKVLTEDILPAIASSGHYQSLVIEISDAIEILKTNDVNHQ